MTACKLCVHPDQAAVADAFAKGLTDRQIGKLFNISHMAAFRHRTQHIVRPLRDQLAIIDKDDRAARVTRQQLAAAAEADAPSTAALIEATIGLRRQMEKLVEVEERLTRVATRAEKDGAHGAVAQVAGAQLRSLEYGSRLAGHPSFSPRAGEASTADAPRFSITIVLDGKETKISTAATPVIEQEADRRDEDGWEHP